MTHPCPVCALKGKESPMKVFAEDTKYYHLKCTDKKCENEALIEKEKSYEQSDNKI